jgi:hypothetical protein
MRTVGSAQLEGGFERLKKCIAFWKELEGPVC